MKRARVELSAVRQKWFYDQQAAIHIFKTKPNNLDATFLMSEAWKKQGNLDLAFSIYSTLTASKVIPDKFVFITLANAIQRLNQPKSVQELWNGIEKYKIKLDCQLYTTLLNSCMSYGDLSTASLIVNHFSQARIIADNILNTSLVKCYTQLQQPEKILELWKHICTHRTALDAHLYSSLIKACTTTSDFVTGHEIYQHLVDTKWVESKTHDRLPVQTALIDFFAKNNNLGLAQLIFKNAAHKDVVIWTAMISAYHQHEMNDLALELFWQMQSQGVSPNEYTFSVILSLIGDSTNLALGKRVHNLIQPTIAKSSLVISSLITMYGKCGALDEAYSIFQSARENSNANVIAWSAFINIYAIHGEVDKALSLFNQAQQCGISPSSTMLVCILNACSHSGRHAVAEKLYNSMQSQFGLVPSLQHKVCLVDNWCRAGEFDKAEAFITSEGLNAVGWKTFLGACLSYVDVRRAEKAVSELSKISPLDAPTYVLLANTYAAAGMFKESKETWDSMARNNIKKIPSITWVTVNGQTEKFHVDENKHKHKREIVNFLIKVKGQLEKMFSYQPDITCVYQPGISKEEKEARLWLHSEKLAIGWALLNHPPATIVLFKNLRVCRDCHTVLKLMSKLMGKTFVVRDANRFHRFENGKCSCNEYW